MSLFTNIINEYLDLDILEEKIIRVKHLSPKQKSLARRYRMKNKSKIKRRLKRYKMKVKNKPKRKGWSYGADGKIHKVVQRKGIRFKKHHN